MRRLVSQKSFVLTLKHVTYLDVHCGTLESLTIEQKHRLYIRIKECESGVRCSSLTPELFGGDFDSLIQSISPNLWMHVGNIAPNSRNLADFRSTLAVVQLVGRSLSKANLKKQ